MTLDELMTQGAVPAIMADHDGLILHVNASFEATFGWRRDEVIGRPLTLIIPPAFRDAHHMGFARFIACGRPSMLNRPLSLMTVTREGRELEAEHFIIAEQRDGRWVFGAAIRPRSGDA